MKEPVGEQRVNRLLNILSRMRRLAAVNNPLEDARFSISMPQLTIMDWVAQNPGVSMRDLAGGLGVSMPTVSVGVRRLEEAGFVRRSRDEEDKRRVCLELTRMGQGLLESVHAFRRQNMIRLLSALSTDEQDLFLELFDRLVGHAEAQLAHEQNEELAKED